MWNIINVGMTQYAIKYLQKLIYHSQDDISATTLQLVF